MAARRAANVTGFVVRRLLIALPVLLGIVLFTFVLARVIPSDPCRAALGERATEAACAEFNARNGLDEPMIDQVGIYVGDLLQGDLGQSVSQRRPVSDLLVERLPVTVQLTVAALFVAVVVGVPLGVLAATRRRSMTDAATMVVANIGVSMPVFLLGLVLQYVFAQALRDTPLALPASGALTAGSVPDPFYMRWGLHENAVFRFVANMDIVNALLTWRWDVMIDGVRHLVLPAVALSTIPMAIVARMTRSSLLEVLSLDYVRAARARGLGERRVVVRHALRNALLPVVTVIGLSFGTLVGGAILTETIFNLAGVGRTVYDAIAARDYTVVQGFTLVVAVSFVIVNLLTDLLYTVLDPRIRAR